MNQYYYHIIVPSTETVQVKKWTFELQRLDESSGIFQSNKITEQIKEVIQNLASLNSEQIQQVGEALFEALFDQQLREDFLSFRKQAINQQQTLKVVLKINESAMPEVVAYPWELMCLPQKYNRGDIHFATDPKLTFFRSRFDSQEEDKLSIQLDQGKKLKIALVVARPTDDPQLSNVEFQQVETYLNQLNNKGKIEFLPVINPATPQNVSAGLREGRPDIFHFIGHGRLQQENNQEMGQIAFVDDWGKANWKKANYFSNLFQQHPPKIVILQACETARESKSNPFKSVASQLLMLQGISVVIAMQATVSNRIASSFVQNFYEEIIKGNSVDLAVQRARYNITVDNDGHEQPYFAIPVIYMNASDGYLFSNFSADKTNNVDTSEEPELKEFEVNVATIEIQETETIPLKRFESETVFVDKRGQIIRTAPCVADYFEQELGKGIEPLKMISIPPGQFWMGAPETETHSKNNERPQHLVEVATFYLSQTPITQAQWRAVASLSREKIELKPNPSCFEGDNLPVESVSWYDAMEFCARLSRLTQQNYRLPSEAEWEYACRSVSSEKSTKQEWNKNYCQPFHFGKTISTELANYGGETTYGDGVQGEYRGKTTPVGNFYPNAFGLYGMHGNVWEWCADPWHDNYDGAPNEGTVWDKQADNDNRYYKILKNLDTLFNDKRRHVLRGGSWSFNAFNCRSAYRDSRSPDFGINYYGFRVVRG